MHERAVRTKIRSNHVVDYYVLGQEFAHEFKNPITESLHRP